MNEKEEQHILRRIVFRIPENYLPLCKDELRTAVPLLLEEVEEVQVNPAQIEKNGTLVLCDSAALCDELRAQGCAVEGYLHKGNEAEKFHGLDYLVSNPGDLDRETLIKLYQRAANLPWTILETERCTLREMTEDDLPSIRRLYDEEARRFLTPPSDDTEMERKIIRAYRYNVYRFYGFGMWVIVDRKSGEVIGRAGFDLPSGEEKDISYGYIIRPDMRRKGIAREITGAIARYVRDVLGIDRVMIYTDQDNGPSIALLHSLHMEKMGICMHEGRQMLCYLMS